MPRSTLVRAAVFLATVAAVWGILILGTGQDAPELEVGSLAKQEFDAERSAVVVDEEETERLREEARAAVPAPRERNEEVAVAVEDAVAEVFDDVAAMAVGVPPADSEVSIPELPAVEESTTTSTASGDGTTVTTSPPAPATLVGQVFVDVDGDGSFQPNEEETRSDVGLAGVAIEVRTHDGTTSVETDESGAWAHQYPGGPAVIVIDTADPSIPEGYLPGGENLAQSIECESGAECPTNSIGLQVNLRPAAEARDMISAEHTALPDETVTYLAGVAAEDVVRAAVGEELLLPIIRAAAVDQARLEMAPGIQPEQLATAEANVRSNPPFVFHQGAPNDEAARAAGEVVATHLQANLLIDNELWEQQRDARAAAVPEVEVEYQEGQNIVDQNDVLTALDIAAIEATSTPSIDEQSIFGLFAVVAVLVSLIGLYLARFRPEFWSRPRMVGLLGIMIVLAAGAIRGTVALQESFTWYVLPAVAFGFVVAVLFDQRIAILMALAVGVLTAAGTLDLGATVYGILAALAPIPFVSAVSSRGAFRSAVVMSSLVAAGVAAATSWFFHVGADESVLEAVGVSVVWAFGVSVMASLLGLAALQFFESAFDITTTLGLLDLTDRNHEALQMLQEEAFGTFNHSLMVGTLADAAARSIGANAILARAMAYYHDLGKTENPTFFIENQFGMSNPHDQLDPSQSADIIRSHVTAGVELAARYKIPTDVTEGIVSHHGDGVMRFFYEKARQMHGVDVDIDDFRHIGHKPRTEESAILMLADSLEAACRAVFQSEEPSPDAIEKVVDRIMDEKMEDGQLSESPLTLAELTKIRQAFLDSLIGHYHQRIAYPNFPGS
ncbi:MAG TPA: HDIG domain-containing protein [Acidimicrobiia bacterium]|nr:HDIG domain-containing protein [Acidimicrobiia bacterium]